MKTLIIQNGVVVNTGVGEPEGAAPEGFSYVVVEDDAYVGIGFTVNEDGTFTAPPPPLKPILD
jgi:hypothetical protein